MVPQRFFDQMAFLDSDEDNSCYSNGAYVDTFHPSLASQSSPLVTSNIDGYFDSIP